MSKVTYLLGAGASYGSRGVLPHFTFPHTNYDESKLPRGILRGLPILNEFSEAIVQLQKNLRSVIEDENSRATIYPILENIRKISKEYPTIDTYSKMLYTTKQIEKYEEFKKQISIFFLLWQKRYMHDIRYDSFIASLIDAETGMSYPEIS